MSDEALKLAREWLVQNECENVNPLTFGEGISLLNEASIQLLARAVIAQAEELERVRKALGEALDEWERSTAPEHDDVHARIVELRRLVMP